MKPFMAWFASVIDTSILLSIVSTQLVLADVAGFGVPVSMGDRVAATVHDLIGLGPALLVLVGASFLVAFPIAHLLARRLGGGRSRWLAAAGLCSLPAAIMLIKLMMGGTLLASARTPAGMLVVAFCGLAGGWFYAWLLQLLEKGRTVDA